MAHGPSARFCNGIHSRTFNGLRTRTSTSTYASRVGLENGRFVRFRKDQQRTTYGALQWKHTSRSLDLAPVAVGPYSRLLDWQSRI
jgi:hypothetical protein